MTQKRLKLAVLATFMLLFAAPSAIATNMSDSMSALQVTEPSVTFISPAAGETFYVNTTDAIAEVTLNYTAEFSYTYTFYDSYQANGYNLTATGDDLAVFIDDKYVGALGKSGAKVIGFTVGDHNITVMAGAFGSGYSNTTVTESVLFTVAVKEASESPGFTALMTLGAIFSIAAIVIRRKEV